jgi:outer membrane receptor protein involved in Fe transport
VNPITGADAARSRENLGRARIRGYQINFDYDTYRIDWRRWARYNPNLHLTIDYLRSEASLVYNPPDPTLEGRRLSLVPWNTGSGIATYRDDLLGEVALQVMYQGMQWEDADNHDRQPAYWLVNLTFARHLPEIAAANWLKNWTAYVKIQNLLDHSYVIDKGGGIPKLGTPFLLQAGLIMPIGLH